MRSIVFKNLPKLEYTRNEQFNSLGVNLKFSGKKRKVICITGSAENIGKSFISINLARKYAEEGQKVLLIDTDLRKSRLVRDYNVQGVDEIKGLSHYLSGQAEMEDVTYGTNVSGFYVIFAGHSVPNPTVLLDSDRLDSLFASVRENYDVVIVDTPPVLPVIDAALVAPRCDGVLLVTSFGYTRKHELMETKKQLETVKATILGTILNQVPTRADKYSYYKRYYRGSYRYRYSRGSKYNKYGYGRQYGYGRVYGDTDTQEK